MKVFNTLTGRKEDFQPKGETVTMYVCGVTVYDDCHIGHAMSYVTFDVIRRYLEFRGYKVKHVQNFTDIDDKIINRAQKFGVPSQELAEKYIAEYFKDMDALNIMRASVYPKATEEVPKIIELIQGLIDKGCAYESSGSVYFRVKTFPNYGKLSHQDVEEMKSSGGVEEAQKEDPLDFALWKAAKPGEPSWPSPWGGGRPGWHIECSAMSLKYLGEDIDIHGGGQDLIFPHHENEITQSEAFTGVVPFVRYWLHNGLLQLAGDKMSKSLGNLVTVKQALERFSHDAIRFFILGSHYRSPLTYSDEILQAAEAGMERLRQAAKGTGEIGSKDVLDGEPFRAKFLESMDDDFNAAQAMAVLFDLARAINRAQEEKQDVSQARSTLVELAGVLGFTLEETTKPVLDAEPFIELLISLRNDLRQARQWQLADKIRDQLAASGIALEDTPKGTIWKRTG
jgi:cysteinyl-tRNA synthetase